MTLFAIFAAIAACWAVQLFFTWRQAQRFMAAVRRLREAGTVSIGVGGKRYRGGRAYVAIAVDPAGTVVGALRLRGVTVFARPKPAKEIVGCPVRRLLGTGVLPGLRANEREAARCAARMVPAGPSASQRTSQETGASEGPGVIATAAGTGGKEAALP